MHPQTLVALRDLRFARLAAKAAFSKRGAYTSFRFGDLRFVAESQVAVALSREIMVRGCYRLPPLAQPPRILDLGANVGLASLFWARQHTGAEIDAFEADPEIFAVLDRNIRSAGFAARVRCHHLAAWVEDSELAFESRGVGSGAGRLAATGSVRVPAVDMKRWIGDRVYDVIKIDIEGAENALIPHCIDALARARFLFCEWHSSPGAPQALGRLTDLLVERGFRYHLESENDPSAPMLSSFEGEFDNQVMIYARRA